MNVVLVLHNIRSVHNAGSIFRTADAAGVSKIFLTGYTPAPIDRFGRSRSDFTKVSLGAEKTVPWEYTTRIASVINNLKANGFCIFALEQHPHSISLFDFTIPDGKQNITLILGNEIRGLSPQILKCADSILEIPMRGSKESLNVSVAAGIALFTLLNRNERR
jgi:23S rRNA (guanosine2251-2'-O)-methyltransferase